MTAFEVLPADPVALAAVKAETMVHSDDFVITSQDDWHVVELDHAADQLGFIGQKYFVESHRSISFPVSFEAEGVVPGMNFMGLAFEGKFATYSKVVVGRIIGGHSVRALCLTFHDVMLLPYFDTLPDDHLLYVPVLAVGSIDNVTN